MRARPEQFTTVTTEGGLLPPDILQRILSGEPDPGGRSPADYGLLENERLNEAINRSWTRLRGAWPAFLAELDRLPEDHPATEATRQRWLLVLLDELHFGRLSPAQPLTIDGQEYAVSHGWGRVPIHLVGCRVDLDRRTHGVAGAARVSPFGLVQQLLNRSDEHLWGMVANGFRLRLLRDNSRFLTASYVEFDLLAMMEGEVYADFALLWLLCHASRFEGETPEACRLERWAHLAEEAGVRALEDLRSGVERALVRLGNGFLAHPHNQALRDRLGCGELSPADFHRQLLRLVYRWLFLFVADDRDLLLSPDADPAARERYQRFYSTQPLRRLAKRPRRSLHGDRYQLLVLLMRLLAGERGGDHLGLPVLDGRLWSDQALPDLEDCQLRNEDLLAAVRALAYTRTDRRLRPVDYRNMGTEELGSVYESLLELAPQVDLGRAEPFALVAGQERRSAGAYYTPSELVQEILDGALDPVVDERLREAGREPQAQAEALLSITVCDPACGSGHFLLGAARRLGKALARVRHLDEEPGPDAVREATREVIGRCLHGVDKNEMAVELCKVALWIEAHVPGRPLSFLDHHIRHGDSLLGVADLAVLDHGFPDEAYQRLQGDEAAVATALRNENRQERGGQAAFDEVEIPPSDEEEQQRRRLATLTNNTVAEIQEKDRLFQRLRSDGTSWWNTARACDAWTAAFLVPKVAANRERVPTTRWVRRARAGHLRGDLVGHLADLAHHHAFFHWPLEFGEVLGRGGFDAIIGNPPFLGGQKITGALGVPYREWLVQQLAGGQRGSADLSAYFFRRAAELVRPGGNFAMLATNTIAQGDTREVGLLHLTENGHTIYRAVPSRPWPGDANLEIAQVWLRRDEQRTANGEQRTEDPGPHRSPFTSHRSPLLDGRPVPAITSYLTPPGRVVGEPHRLAANAGKSFIGSYVLGMGFVLTPEEAQALLDRDPRNADVLFPYLNGQDLNSRPDQSPSRWVINFHDWPLERAEEYADCLAIVREKVKPERDLLRRAVRRERWWQFAERAPALYAAIAGMERVLVLPRVSKFLLSAFQPTTIVSSEQTVVVASASTAAFAALQNEVHEVWARDRSSTLETRLRYAPSDCFETFPLPLDLTGLEAVGEAYHEHRRQVMLSRQEGLTKTYNRFHDPAEAAEDIAELRRLHVAMDQAVAAAYGWADLDLGHGFHETRQGQRYTLHPDARQEVLDRLLALNHERYAEEVEQGLHGR
jgi:hypothetical protein